MAHILKNNNLEIHIDFPGENYSFSRFDWTGKITKVKFKDVYVSGIENPNSDNEYLLGKGFYNEFGIDKALGFEETKIGGWFHKIGIGLLRKTDNQYLFSKTYEIKPAEFTVDTGDNSLIITCRSSDINGYAYVLKKEIVLHDSSFTIHYDLQNKGAKDIVTDEYVHNFTAINKEFIGENYILKFPFKLNPLLFGETVNPEQKVAIGQDDIRFKGPPTEQFFFSNLTGHETVDAMWKLINLKSKIGLSESCSFQTDKVNLWGWKHVISPELFFDVSIKSGKSTQWSRTYHIFDLKKGVEESG